ncbi:MAG TPA: thioredoxin-disulfide reductase [Planctomycetota bacterium]
MSQARDVVIIGSGPAGYTAALYAARANLKPLVIEGMQPGGQLTITSDVENYPGYPEGVLGPKMMEDFRKQAERFGAEIQIGMVTELDVSKRPFVVTSEFATVEAHAVIICTGAAAKLLGLEKERELMASGGGVSACATCDGAFFPGKEVVVVGGGDTAMEEANFLTRYAKKVTVFHRREVFKASKIMLERAQKNPKIAFQVPTVVEDVLVGDDGKIRGVRAQNPETQESFDFPCQGLFVAIGHEPNSKIFRGKLDMDETGYLKVHDGTRTSVEGVFAAGDVCDKRYRQAITAAGMGCMAAIDAERWLESQGH